MTWVPTTALYYRSMVIRSHNIYKNTQTLENLYVFHWWKSNPRPLNLKAGPLLSTRVQYWKYFWPISDIIITYLFYSLLIFKLTFIYVYEYLCIFFQYQWWRSIRLVPTGCFIHNTIYPRDRHFIDNSEVWDWDNARYSN